MLPKQIYNPITKTYYPVRERSQLDFRVESLWVAESKKQEEESFVQKFDVVVDANIVRTNIVWNDVAVFLNDPEDPRSSTGKPIRIGRGTVVEIYFTGTKKRV